MEKMKILLRLSLKFALKYTLGYILALIKPVLSIIIGFVILIICTTVYQQYALWGLLSLPFICFGFWRGFLVAYSLNLAMVSFLKNTSSLKFKDYYEIVKKDGGNIAKWVSFCSIITIILYLPAAYLSLKYPTVETQIISFGLTTILLIPFLNYFTQAFFFRMPYENYFKLFFNCYTKLDGLGIFLAVIITLISLVASTTLSIVPYIFIGNVFIYALNASWYSSRK